jgi:hypothetical protein
VAINFIAHKRPKALTLRGIISSDDLLMEPLCDLLAIIATCKKSFLRLSLSPINTTLNFHGKEGRTNAKLGINTSEYKRTTLRIISL